MSSAPDQFPQSSKQSSSSRSEKAKASPAPESSSPAETMTDQTPNAMLATPPTRMTAPDDAAPEQDMSEAVGSTPTSDAAPVQTTEPQPTESQPVTPEASAASAEAPDALPLPPRHQPIPPASEPMQYRAIGLVRGKYMPSEEQFTRGFILTEDEVLIDAVLLGRVMSLVKKHINLEESHLWVVYPRTREKDLELHMQIVGVWEPEKLNRSTALTEDDDAEEADTEADAEVDTDVEEVEASETEVADAAPEPSATDAEVASAGDLDDRYFSVRGEVVYQSEEEQRLLVKIRRAPKQGSTQAKAFKVALKGALGGKAIGYFWDLHVQRENNELVIKEANQIGMVPPQKRKGGSGGPRRGGRPGGPGGPGGPRRGGPGGQSGPPRKRWPSREGEAGGASPRPARSDRPASPSTPRQPISKPIKRRPKGEES